MTTGFQERVVSESSVMNDAEAIVERMGGRPRFSDDVREWLNKPPDVNKMKTRPGAGNRDLTYLAWNVVAEMLMDKFGADGWAFEVLSQTQTPLYGVDPETGQRGALVGYSCSATARLTIWDEYGNAINRTNVGAEDALFVVTGDDKRKRWVGAPQQADALQKAQKGAVSRALPRAAALLGNRFGLLLYDRATADLYAKEIKKRKNGGRPSAVNVSRGSGGANASRPANGASAPNGGSVNGGSANGSAGVRGVICPTHGGDRVRENDRGYFCATRVGEDANGKAVFCNKKPVLAAGVTAPPRPAPTPAPTRTPAPPAPPTPPGPATPIGAPGGHVNGASADEPEPIYGCPQHKAGLHVKPSRFGGYWCTFREEDGSQCKRTDMVPVLINDGYEPAGGQSMQEWDAIAAKGDPERDAAIAEFYSVVAHFGENWNTPEKADASFVNLGAKSVSEKSVAEIREDIVKMREKVLKTPAR